MWPWADFQTLLRDWHLMKERTNNQLHLPLRAHARLARSLRSRYNPPEAAQHEQGNLAFPVTCERDDQIPWQ